MKTRSELRNIAMVILYQIDIYEDRKNNPSSLLDDEKRTTSCNSFRGDGKTNKFYNM